MKTLPRMTAQLYLLTGLVLLNSCTHQYYAPNVHPVPLFQQKGETRISAIFWGGTDASGFEGQVAHAVSNHAAVLANLVTAYGKYEEEKGNGFLLEGGGGYFKPIGQYVVLEAYGGLGGGSVHNRYSQGQTTSAGLFRLFGQPSIGFTTPYFDAAFSTRVAYLHFTNLEGVISDLTGGWNAQGWQQVKDHRSCLLLEPALTIRGGWKYIKLQTQLGLSYNATYPDFPQEVINMNLGLYISLADKYQKKK